MLIFPNAKINLGLHILSRRSDGFHNLESCLYPIPWHDALEAIPSEDFQFTQTGLSVPGDPLDNLCVKAYHLLVEEYEIPAAQLHLHKMIPMGAGLGGGSADGAFTLKLLNNLFEIGLSISELEALAAQLGSDCPFFIKNTPAFATGTGTKLEPIGVDLSEFYLGVICPQVHVKTAEAYGSIIPHIPTNRLEDTLNKPIESWQEELINDFEEPVARKYQEIGKALRFIRSKNPIYAAMSGSGSSVFGIFDTPPDAKEFNLIEQLVLP